MKKLISITTIALIVLLSLTACTSGGSNTNIEAGTYYYQTDKVGASLLINSDGTFVFTDSYMSQTGAYTGQYSVSENELTLIPDKSFGGKYVFTVKDGRLYFEQYKSSSLSAQSNITDNGEFILSNESQTE